MGRTADDENVIGVCQGRVDRLSGQSRVPAPPVGITAQKASPEAERLSPEGGFGSVLVELGKAHILVFLLLAPVPALGLERTRPCGLEIVRCLHKGTMIHRRYR